jgi:hypothetical protein
MFHFFRWLKEDFKAWRRGEQRVAPRGIRGRVYERTDQAEAGPLLKAATTKPEVVISAKVYRAATGEWEDHGVIAKGQADIQKGA